MKTMMMIPPNQLGLAVVGAAIGGGQLADAGTWSLFMDLQAEVTELDMKRYLVEHQIPAREGGILQDMGSASSRILVKGKWIYENRPDHDILDLIPLLGGSRIAWNWARVMIMQLVYRSKHWTVFASDIITTLVMIEALRIRKVGGQPNVFEYSMVLKEWNPNLTVYGTLGQIQSIIPPIIDREGETGGGY